MSNMSKKRQKIIGIIAAIAEVSALSGLFLVVCEAFRVYKSELFVVVFSPLMIISAIGTYNIATRKNLFIGKALLLISLAMLAILGSLLIGVPALSAGNIHVYSPNVSLSKFIIPSSDMGILLRNINVGEVPRTYYIIVHNSGNNFIKIEISGLNIECRKLPRELIDVTVRPIVQLLAPNDTKTIKVTIYSKINYSDICNLLLEISTGST